MGYVWWGLAVFLILCLSIYFLKIRLLFYFFRVPESKEAYVRFSFLHGLLSYTLYIPLTDSSISETQRKRADEEVTPEEAEKFFIQVKEKLEHIENLHYIIRSFLNKIEIHTFLWRTAIGMKDAAWTGVAAGSLWAIKGSVLSAAHRMMNMTAIPEIEVTPVFGQSIWKVECSCMISFRAGHAITAVIQLFFHRRSRKKRSNTGLFF
ncbi:DUF2953 domain-containing protein [Pseudobacillus sp. FSL P4-0506]|uniref:DUF2953 domain-containing protein n=1 Tax=unclassified Pseudobacillus TaxID=2619284 RepID=UPI0030F9702A